MGTEVPAITNESTVAELWRYPIKSMRGERAQALDVEVQGFAGDRRFAIGSSGAPRGKPLLSGAERAAMLRFAATGSGHDIHVISPDGEVYRIGDSRLLPSMENTLPGKHNLSLIHSGKPLTDVRPVLLLGTGTVAQLEQELGVPVDARRFRANVLLHMAHGFAEDSFAGRDLCLGPEVVLRVTERCPRCRVVTLDPETGAADPRLMRHLDRTHGGRVGIYATVLRPGSVRVGDAIMLQ